MLVVDLYSEHFFVLHFVSTRGARDMTVSSCAAEFFAIYVQLFWH